MLTLIKSSNIWDVGKCSANFAEEEMKSQWPGSLPRSLNKSVSGLGVLLRNFWLWIFCSTKVTHKEEAYWEYIPVFMVPIKPGRSSNLVKISFFNLNFMSECTLVRITYPFIMSFIHVDKNFEKSVCYPFFFCFILSLFFFKNLFQSMKPKLLKNYCDYKMKDILV